MKSVIGPTTWSRPGRTTDPRTVLFGGGILLTTAGALALSWSLLPREAALPALATACFALAAVTALAARLRAREPADRVTLWDVAGALTFIGICVSALIVPEHLVQIVESPRH